MSAWAQLSTQTHHTTCHSGRRSRSGPWLLGTSRVEQGYWCDIFDELFVSGLFLCSTYLPVQVGAQQSVYVCVSVWLGCSCLEEKFFPDPFTGNGLIYRSLASRCDLIALQLLILIGRPQHHQIRNWRPRHPTRGWDYPFQGEERSTSEVPVLAKIAFIFQNCGQWITKSLVLGLFFHFRRTCIWLRFNGHRIEPQELERLICSWAQSPAASNSIHLGAEKHHIHAQLLSMIYHWQWATMDIISRVETEKRQECVLYCVTHIFARELVVVSWMVSLGTG